MKEQPADLMDFKYTRSMPFLIGMWADFLTAEEKRMDQDSPEGR